MLTFKSYLDEGVNDPAIFKAVFLAGGPGSGKSFIVGRTALTALGFKLINSDIAFEKALAKAGLDKSNPDDIYSVPGQAARISAKALTDKQMNLAVDGRLGLVIDGTGKDFDKIKQQAVALKRLGYEVAMVFVNTDMETAIARNNKRERKLPPKMVSQMWKDVQKNIGKFQNLFGGWMLIVDNSDGANYEGAVRSVYKRMAKWVSMEPKMPQAKAWIQGRKKK